MTELRTTSSPSVYLGLESIAFAPGFESITGDYFTTITGDSARTFINGGTISASNPWIASSDGNYRYGFNGKENDKDVKGIEGSQEDYGMRIYDSRVGRFLSVDPVLRQYPMLTPYQFASNSPVSGIDIDGLEYSPAGKKGIFAIDGTAVKFYPRHPAVLQQEQQDAPRLRLLYMVQAASHKDIQLISQSRRLSEYDQQVLEAKRSQWYDDQGFNEDGSKKPLTRLAENKTWNAFANNLALPLIEPIR